MLFDKDGNITLITQEKVSIVELVRRLDKSYHRFKNDNVIVNLSSLSDVTLDHLIEFLLISNKHRGSGHSFVIVTNKIDYDEAPDEIVIVPTLQEAYDIIEMEEMERDLGI
ncbi:MAG: ribonuclease Z [Bacteroidia bacterium]|nr:ribonuclease Z [Bacteroidia bacterium]NND52554.1 ribonuclease Z [Flavobacteriaceae bacterium]